MQLTQDHDQLRQAMQVFAKEMQMDKPDLPLITRLRISFSSLFRQHMQREDALITALAKQPSDTVTAQIIETHRSAMRDLFLRYSTHIKTWAPEQIASDWAGYSRDVLDLQRRLKDCMVWEERMLYPLERRTR